MIVSIFFLSLGTEFEQTVPQPRTFSRINFVFWNVDWRSNYLFTDSISGIVTVNFCDKNFEDSCPWPILCTFQLLQVPGINIIVCGEYSKLHVFSVCLCCRW